MPPPHTLPPIILSILRFASLARPHPQIENLPTSVWNRLERMVPKRCFVQEEYAANFELPSMSFHYAYPYDDTFCKYWCITQICCVNFYQFRRHFVFDDMSHSTKRRIDETVFDETDIDETNIDKMSCMHTMEKKYILYSVFTHVRCERIHSQTLNCTHGRGSGGGLESGIMRIDSEGTSENDFPNSPKTVQSPTLKK